MTGQRFDLPAPTGGREDTVALGIAVVAVLLAAIGAIVVQRNQIRHTREESGYAQRVFARITEASSSAAISLSARRKLENLELPVEGMTAIAREEAELYLQHHRMALKHHAEYQRASLWSGLLGFAVVLVGAALTSVAGLDVGAVTALAGAIPAAAGRLLFRQAGVVGDRAAENLRGLEDSVRRFTGVQGALAATAEIGDRPTRNRMYEVIVLHLLFPAQDLESLIQKRPET